MYLKNLEIIKNYIFKGVDGKIKFKKTAFQLFLSDELIDGLEKGLNAKKIMNESYLKWKNLDINVKLKYFSKKEFNNSILDIAQNYQKINSFLVFIYHYLSCKIKNNENIPSIYELANLFIKLSKTKKLLYDDYSNHFLFLKFKIRDIYDAIHGIRVKTPSGALRIFLQEKAVKGEINNIKEGINKWSNLSVDEKEVYLSKCHIQFLSFKYKQLLYDKKIKRFLPNKPGSPFSIFIRKNKGINIPKGFKTFEYYRYLYNKLPDEEKIKYQTVYDDSVKIYNQKILDFKNKEFDLPKKPKSSFSFYLSDRLEQFYRENSQINLNKQINIIFKDWSSNLIDKSYYEEKAEKDKKRFEIEIKEFESLGYYSKTFE